MAAGAQDLAVDLDEQRRRHERALDRDELARLDVRRVADEDRREALDAGVSHRDCALQEAPLLPDQLAVGVDLALGAQVADQVPVQLRVVQPAELREARAERDVDRAADLLVEEDVAREAVDLVVEPEGELAEHGGAGVHLEQRAEEVGAARGLGRDHAPALEPEPHVGDLAALEDAGEAEADLAARLRLDAGW